MKTKINEHQLKFLLQYIIDNFETFGPKMTDGRLTFGKMDSPQSLDLSGRKTPLSYKKILFPNGIDVKQLFANQKIAFLGLPDCDVTALNILINQLPEGLGLKRENIFVMGVFCRPDKFCFCDKFGNTDFAGDVFLETAGANYNLYGKTLLAKMVLNKSGIKYSDGEQERKTQSQGKFDIKKIGKLIEYKEEYLEFWQKIADQCFGCGACTAVCPLCFCTRQEISNNLDGSCSQCLNWDSCFAKRFSEVQHNFDLRPSNADRLYNWYHHKFVRSKEHSKEVLCSGCGRCIAACSANLNINKILESLTEQENNEK